MRDETNINKNHYYDRSYLKKERLFSYAEQIELVKKYTKADQSILEIGMGNGYVYHFLQDYFSYNISCMDINPDLNADITDDIINPKHVSGKSFDVVACFEVLEHMPIAEAAKAVENMIRIAKKHILISVPDMRYFISLNFSLFLSMPFRLRKVVTFPRIKKRKEPFGNDHSWEIGIVSEKIYTSNNLVRRSLFSSLKIVEDYRCFEVPWHHYYVISL